MFRIFILLLLESVDDTHGAEDGIERLLDGVERTAVYARDAPRQVGIDAPAVVELPVGTEVDTQLQMAHLVAEIVGSPRVWRIAQLDACAGGVALAQIAVVDMAFEDARGDTGDVGATLEQHITDTEGGIDGHGEHPLLALGDQIAGVDALDAVAVLGHLHVVVLDGGVNLHRLVLEVETGEQTPRAPHVALDIDAQREVGLEVELVHLADGGRHAYGRRATDVVAQADDVIEAVGQAYGAGGERQGHEQGEYGDFLHCRCHWMYGWGLLLGLTDETHLVDVEGAAYGALEVGSVGTR